MTFPVVEGVASPATPFLGRLTEEGGNGQECLR